MKKLFLILILCPLLLFCQADASMSIRLDSGALLLSRDGEELLPFGIYDDIVSLGDQLYAVGNDDRYTLMDESGSLRSEKIYSYLERSGNILIAETDGLRGLLSTDGAPLTDFVYTHIVPVGDEHFWAIQGDEYDPESDEVYILDSKGNEIATGLFIQRMKAAGDVGLLAVLRSASGLWGYCDAEGEMTIPARYTYTGAFLHGLAAVVENGFYGAISADGHSVIPAEYDYLEICNGGFVLAGLNRSGIWVFDLNGNEIAHYIGDETTAAPVGDGYTVYDGETVAVYTSAGNLRFRSGQESCIMEGLDGQLLLADGAWGEKCVSIAGTSARYQNLYPLGYANGEAIYAYMQANTGRSVNDQIGEIQISLDMESARYGVVSAQGEIELSAKYESILYLEDNRLLVCAEDTWQVVDISGKVYWTYSLQTN